MILIAGGVPMNDNIYAINMGKEYLLLNLDTLENTTIPKEIIKQKNFRLTDYKQLNRGGNYIDEYVPQNNVQLIKPTIITSFECNYACEYCFQKEMTKTRNKTTIEDVKRIKQFYEKYCKIFKIPLEFGSITIMGGEPLLPGNREVLERIANSFPNSTLKITTNGSYLNEYKDFILNNRVKIKVSLDGTKETHFKNRKCKDVCVYDNTIKGLEWLVKNNIDTTVITVFNSNNIKDYPKFLNIMEKIGWRSNKCLKVGFISQIGCGVDDITGEKIVDDLKAFKLLKQMDSRIKDVDARKLVPGSINLLEALYLAKQKKYSPYRCSCLEAPNFAFFPDGTVHICAATSGDIGCIGRYKPFVRIDKKKIEQFHKRRIDSLSKCKNCSMKVFCKGSCVATLIKKTNNILDVDCGFWKEPKFLEFLELVL